MVKASEGGGGKGIRMSHSDEDMRSHFVQVGKATISIFALGLNNLEEQHGLVLTRLLLT